MEEDIYIKNRPEFIRVNPELADKRKIERDELSKDIFSIDEPDKYKEGVDYTGLDSFWMKRSYEPVPSMIQVVEQKYNFIDEIYEDAHDVDKLYGSMESLEQDFTKLSTFLGKAKYVGRFFRRTEPIHHSKKYCNDDNQVFVLYATNDALLVKTRDEEVIQIISSEFLEDGKYEFYGEINPNFDNKEAVYQEICNQLKNRRRGLRI